MSPSNGVTQSLPVLAANAQSAAYVELQGYRSSTVRLGTMTLGRGFSNAYFLYKREVVAPHPQPHCRHHPDCRPLRPWRATGRDTDVRRTWIALSTVRPTCAPWGAYSGGGMARNCEAIGSHLAPFARLPEGQNGARSARIFLRSRPPSTTKAFLPAKVVFGNGCWSPSTCFC